MSPPHANSEPTVLEFLTFDEFSNIQFEFTYPYLFLDIIE